MKKIIALIIVVVAIILVVMYSKPADMPASGAARDSTATIDEDLNSIDASAEFEADMESLDSDINSL